MDQMSVCHASMNEAEARQERGVMWVVKRSRDRDRIKDVARPIPAIFCDDDARIEACTCGEEVRGGAERPGTDVPVGSRLAESLAWSIGRCGLDARA